MRMCKIKMRQDIPKRLCAMRATMNLSAGAAGENCLGRAIRSPYFYAGQDDGKT